MADVAMDDMQIDFDMEEEQDPEIARLKAEAEAINTRIDDGDMVVEEAPEEGELDSSSAAPTKVHVRGLNDLNTRQIEAWVGDVGLAEHFKRVQWIDDTSANLIFDSDASGAEALTTLSLEEVTDPRQLRAARGLAEYPGLELQVRQAILADVKAPRAKDRSAFYLFHKEWDPDNPDNVRPDRKRKRYESDLLSHKYRRRSRPEPTFNEDLYDDAPAAARRQRSGSPASDRSRMRDHRNGRDLMDGRDRRRLRDRSASPTADGDGRYGFDESQPRRSAAPPRRRSPDGTRAGVDSASTRTRKELFPDRATVAGHMDSRPESGTTTPRQVRELMPSKSPSFYHRRHDAQDLHPDEIARAIGARPARNGDGDGSGRDLFSRVKGGPKVESRHGRLNDPARNNDDDDFSIKGAGTTMESSGFSILGASRERAENPLIKELFPIKAGISGGDGGGGGRDLFDGKIKGRGTQRRRAEDLF